jgi:hypothetical protein
LGKTVQFLLPRNSADVQLLLHACSENAGLFCAPRSLPFALQKLFTSEAAIFPIIARSGEKLATEEQRNRSTAVK